MRRMVKTDTESNRAASLTSTASGAIRSPPRASAVELRFSFYASFNGLLRDLPDETELVRSWETAFGKQGHKTPDGNAQLRGGLACGHNIRSFHFFFFLLMVDINPDA